MVSPRPRRSWAGIGAFYDRRMKTDGYARAVICYLSYGVVGLSVAWSLSYLFPAAMTDRAFAKGLIELVMVFAIPIFIGIGWIVVLSLRLRGRC